MKVALRILVSFASAGFVVWIGVYFLEYGAGGDQFDFILLPYYLLGVFVSGNAHAPNETIPKLLAALLLGVTIFVTWEAIRHSGRPSSNGNTSGRNTH